MGKDGNQPQSPRLRMRKEAIAAMSAPRGDVQSRGNAGPKRGRTSVPPLLSLVQAFLFRLGARDARATPRTTVPLLLTVGILASLPQIASSVEQVQKTGFSISPPPGWREIPTDVIAACEKDIARKAPNAPSQHYDYGFQPADSKTWFDYPYILIQVRESGRLSERQLGALEGCSMEDRVNQLKKGLGSFVTDM
jgi:hypothetical protein